MREVRIEIMHELFAFPNYGDDGYLGEFLRGNYNVSFEQGQGRKDIIEAIGRAAKKTGITIRKSRIEEYLPNSKNDDLTFDALALFVADEREKLELKKRMRLKRQGVSVDIYFCNFQL